MSDNKRDNSGILSRNEDKDGPGANPKWPDYKGSVTAGGVDYWLSGWLKNGPHGKFLSLSLKPKDEIARRIPTGRPAVASDKMLF
jgi:hypothetical protein